MTHIVCRYPFGTTWHMCAITLETECIYFQGPNGCISLANFMEGTLEDYTKQISQDAVWADHVALLAMAKMLERDILIVTSSPDGGPDDTITWITGKSDFKGDPILLGHLWENHYESLKPKGIFCFSFCGLILLVTCILMKNMCHDPNVPKTVSWFSFKQDIMKVRILPLV